MLYPQHATFPVSLKCGGDPSGCCGMWSRICTQKLVFLGGGYWYFLWIMKERVWWLLGRGLGEYLAFPCAAVLGCGLSASSKRLEFLTCHCFQRGFFSSASKGSMNLGDFIFQGVSSGRGLREGRCLEQARVPAGDSVSLLPSQGFEVQDHA